MSFVIFHISLQFKGESLVKAQGRERSPERKAQPETNFPASESPFQHPTSPDPVDPSQGKLSSPNLWKCTELFRKLFELSWVAGKSRSTGWSMCLLNVATLTDVQLELCQTHWNFFWSPSHACCFLTLISCSHCSLAWKALSTFVWLNTFILKTRHWHYFWEALSDLPLPQTQVKRG